VRETIAAFYAAVGFGKYLIWVHGNGVTPGHFFIVGKGGIIVPGLRPLAERDCARVVERRAGKMVDKKGLI
jgi:hypothetical protein